MKTFSRVLIKKHLAYIRLGGYIKTMTSTAHTLKALSDETRLRILVLLMDGELCVCDIMAVLSLPQSTASRHLAYLRNTGWISGTRRGKWMYHQLTCDAVFSDPGLAKHILQYLSTLKQGRHDLEKLKEHMRAKDKNACSVVD